MTAVEKLEIKLLGLISFDSEELRAKYKEAIKQAKEMEKQQIIDANRDGVDMVIDNVPYITGEQYYNETFKK